MWNDFIIKALMLILFILMAVWLYPSIKKFITIIKENNITYNIDID